MKQKAAQKRIEINLEIDYSFENFFKKNFQKHLVSLEKVFTFALANRQTDDRNSMLIYAKRTKF
ncbi:hypothetical protein, partial [Soonwooa purpurea]